MTIVETTPFDEFTPTKGDVLTFQGNRWFYRFEGVVTDDLGAVERKAVWRLSGPFRDKACTKLLYKSRAGKTTKAGEMPDRRLGRARATLPSGYQFGDAWLRGLSFRPAKEPEIAIRLVQQFDIVNIWSYTFGKDESKYHPECICQAVMDGEIEVPIGKDVSCPYHPQRTFTRGPAGMFS